MLRVAILTAAVSCCSSALAQDEPHKLEPAFTDDFSKDTRADYKIEGDVAWESGRLTLAQGASVERMLDAGTRAKVDLRWKPVGLSPARPLSESRIWFRLDGATSCFVRLARRLEAGKAVLVVGLFDTDDQDGKPVELLVREYVLENATPGLATIEYRSGLLRLAFENDEPFWAYIENGNAPVVAVRFQSVQANAELSRIAVHVTPRDDRGFTNAEVQQLAVARAASAKINQHYRDGNFAEAAKYSEQCLEIAGSVLGRHHANYARSLNALAFMRSKMGDYVGAEPLYVQALEIRKSLLGEHHPEYAVSLNNLAELYRSMGDYIRAEPLSIQSLMIRRSVQGEEHPAHAASLNNLAFLYERRGDYARAEPLFKQARDIYRSHREGRDPVYVTTLGNLAALYHSMGDYDRAQPLFEEAVSVSRSLLGHKHPDYALSLNNLAFMYHTKGDTARAEPLYEEASAIWKSALGVQHPLYANSLMNRASVCRSRGDYSQAETLYRQAIEVHEAVLGEHPYHADSLINLAALHRRKGEYALAEPLARRALDIWKSTVGARHPSYAVGLQQLAGLQVDRGAYRRAEPLLKQALDIQRRQLDQNATAQSARQQNANQNRARDFLDDRLTNAVASASDPDSVARDVWQWKGAVTGRQQAYRRVAANPKLAPLFVELRSVTQQLSVASRQAPNPPPKSAPETRHQDFRRKREVWEKRVADLTREREGLEREMASASRDFRYTVEPLTADAVRSRLPDGTVFVDFLEYKHRAQGSVRIGQTDYERRYLAVVVPSTGPLRLIGLGSTESIRDAIMAFRKPLTGRPGSQEGATEAARKLREMLWLPLEKHLAGAETVIFSPDTALGTLPFAALPGREPDSFLIEDYKLASIPFANLMRYLPDSPAARNAPRLLAMGDVAYDGGRSGSPIQDRELRALAGEQGRLGRTSRETTDRWESLSGFRAELDTVRALHRQRFGASVGADILSGASATESTFLTRAPDYDTLHLITHGFFSDPTMKSISQAEISRNGDASVSRGPDPFFNKWLPGLLSGLVMAGANNPPDDPENLNDGVLRAAEIEASSMQGVDLVVLSACETGLGAVAGGEGLTGLQRAFHIAGVRSVVASLWKVDDRATQELMKHFYTNLWIKKQSKIDALRNAQLWMLRNPDRLAAMGVKEPRTRGEVRRLNPTKPGETPTGRTSPYFWAAFTLSGDWR